MLAKYFRRIDEDGNPAGEVGLVVGADMREIFWRIDEFCDPYMCQIKSCHAGGFIVHQTIDRFEDEVEVSLSDLGVSELTPWFDDDGWKTPKWPDTAYPLPTTQPA